MQVLKNKQSYLLKRISASAKNENYSFEIIKGKFNNDEYEDAVIAVNRYEYAVDKASKITQSSRRAEIGFMGYENFFISLMELHKTLIPNPL